jgi:tRNA threonylcarbamoyl adenosine modification protein (Sua5/YciO/YrdC/YwlC family)
MSLILHIHPKDPQRRHITKVVETLQNGGIVVYPTDTIYGLGCSIYAKAAIQRIYRIKRQDLTKPMSFVIADLKNINSYARVSKYAYRALRHHLPGPYTFLLPASREVPKKLWSKRKTVGIRVPDNKICRMIVQELGHPVVSTSVTDPNGNILNNPDDIQEYFGKVVDTIVDGGALGTVPSSIIDLTEDIPEIVREGAGDVSWFK